MVKAPVRYCITLLLVAIIFDNNQADAFTTQNHQHSRSIANMISRSPLSIRPQISSASSLDMVKFDKSIERWVPESPDEEADAGYGLAGTLLRAGPLPLFQRLFNSDKYDQAVLKYMARDGCDRKEAQGNMVSQLEFSYMIG